MVDCGKHNWALIHDAVSREWLFFDDPLEIYVAKTIDEVLPVLAVLEKRIEEQGVYAAGYISYEAAPAFDSALTVRNPGSFPLLWFGVYADYRVISPSDMVGKRVSAYPNWSPSVDRQQYNEALARIKEYIAAGDTYQVNYTFRLSAPYESNPLDLFMDMIHGRNSNYAACIDTESHTICSSSPELFFHLDDRTLVSRPMKGTASRGRTLSEDRAMADWLSESGKNRAENVMIVDMVRNDMGRIAETGSVAVPELFTIEKYPTVWQMTSAVTARTDASITDIFRAMFPCASITGAPKPRTMQIIAELESSPRNMYTGTIGFIKPGRKAQFNVAIRTVLVDNAARQAEYGTGGGIVWDSETGAEFEECLMKNRVVTERIPDFSLLETMAWMPGTGYFLLDYHLRRLRDSAAYFDINIDIDNIYQQLISLSGSFQRNSQRVRLLVSPKGELSVEAAPFDSATSNETPVRLGLAPTPVDSASPFLYHKTTFRQVYDAARSSCADCEDVILWNERGEITETSIANIVVERNETLLTPPVACGLLPGTFRSWLLDRRVVQEEAITIEDLKRASRMYTINSVRKWRPAVFCG